MPLVSIIIPCYNAERWIGETLRSVLAQTGADLQVIVVDDGSTDASAELVAREFPDVELIRTVNGGQCRARNRGLEAARGEFIQFLDADDVLLPNKIRAQLECLAETNADIVYSDWRKLYQHAGESVTQGETIVRSLDDEPACALVHDGWSPPHAYLFRREIVARVGAFSESYPMTGDARFAIECALRGARFVHQPGVYALYRLSENQLSRQNPRAFCREVLNSTREAHTWWRTHGGITSKRRAALVQSYGNAARMSYEVDRATFWAAYRVLLELEPHYMPTSPRSLSYVSRLVGYPRAEALARVYRVLKRTALGAIGCAPSKPIPFNARR